MIGLQEKGLTNQLTNNREERIAQAGMAKLGLTGQIDLAKIAERTAAAQTAANNDLLIRQAEMMNTYADKRYQQDRRDAMLMMGLQALSGFFG